MQIRATGLHRRSFYATMGAIIPMVIVIYFIAMLAHRERFRGSG
jgi:hypothetical protein